MNEINASVFVGIDVSKTRLDVCVGENGTPWDVANTPEGIVKLITRLKESPVPTLIVLESTGGFGASRPG